MSNFTNHLNKIQKQIKTSASKAKRDKDNIQLVAVSKKQPIERIQNALDAGQRLFGENRVQEAYTHWQDIRCNNTYPELCLHLIGPLQSNKAADAVALFDVMHSLDREKIARVMADEQEKQGRRLQYFIQVNTGEEHEKSGILPKDLESFYKTATETYGLNVVGLMCLPPVDEAAGLHFALLAKLAKGLGIAKLSMGMSDDYDLAVQFGATHLRVGSALFGARPQS